MPCSGKVKKQKRESDLFASIRQKQSNSAEFSAKKEEARMAGMPERIGKGPIFRRLDIRYADQKLRGIALQRLTNPANPNDDVADIGMQPDAAGNIVLSQNDGDHIKDHWFNRNARGWWGARYVKDTLKWGLITALQEADKDGKHKPIKTLWI